MKMFDHPVRGGYISSKARSLYVSMLAFDILYPTQGYAKQAAVAQHSIEANDTGKTKL